MSKCVLICDDDESILFLCKTILAQSEYRVETLSNSENILHDIIAIKPDVVFMDLWIPDISGEIAVSMIKADPATKHIPVILFSANAKIKEITTKINADGYLEKPFEIATLKQTIAKYISN